MIGDGSYSCVRLGWECLLPAVSWRALDGLYLRSRPDLDGRYVVDADYRLDFKTGFAARYDGDLYTQASYRFNPRLEGVLSADFREEGGSLYGARIR